MPLTFCHRFQYTHTTKLRLVLRDELTRFQGKSFSSYSPELTLPSSSYCMCATASLLASHLYQICPLTPLWLAMLPPYLHTSSTCAAAYLARQLHATLTCLTIHLLVCHHPVSLAQPLPLAYHHQNLPTVALYSLPQPSLTHTLAHHGLLFAHSLPLQPVTCLTQLITGPSQPTAGSQLVAHRSLILVHCLPITAAYQQPTVCSPQPTFIAIPQQPTTCLPQPTLGCLPTTGLQLFAYYLRITAYFSAYYSL